MWPFRKKKNQEKKEPPKKYLPKNSNNPNKDYLNQWGVHEALLDTVPQDEGRERFSTPRFDTHREIKQTN